MVPASKDDCVISGVLFVHMLVQRASHKWVPGANQSFLEIGTSVRRSSRSAFGRLTGNDVSGHYKHHYFLFSFLFSFFFSFLFSFFPVVYFSHRRSAPIKKLI